MKRLRIAFYLFFIALSPLYAKTVDLTIAILPSDTAAKKTTALNSELHHAFKHCGIKTPSGFKDIPHISVFTGRFDKKDIQKLKNSIYRIAQAATEIPVTLPDKIDIQHNNVSWFAEINPQLNFLANDVMYYALPISQSRFLSHQDSANSMLSLLDRKQVDLIKEHGSAWLLSTYEPTLTIFYDLPFKTECMLEAIDTLKTEKTSFRARYIAIGEIGETGNMTKILMTYSLISPGEKHDGNKLG